MFESQKRTLVFSGVEHQKADWIGIHEKICQLLIPLRTPDPFFSSQEDRQHRQAQILHRQVFLDLYKLYDSTGERMAIWRSRFQGTFEFVFFFFSIFQPFELSVKCF